ncbi:hypothetical protein [Rhizobacter sp. Root404]|uniref:hypothetical protein n=1 Tax=Rhizobacter sp. Root404 TaxID=1736528 RepID=UPI000AD37BA1|nr:hypothetical protein [Rhizobacter sp. Root404]
MSDQIENQEAPEAKPAKTKAKTNTSTFVIKEGKAPTNPPLKLGAPTSVETKGGIKVKNY